MPAPKGNTNASKKNGPPKVAIALRVEEEHLKAIDAAANSKGVSRNEFMESAAVRSARRVNR